MSYNTGSYALIIKQPRQRPRLKRPVDDDQFSALELYDELVRQNPGAEIIVTFLANGKIEVECAETIRAIRDAP